MRINSSWTWISSEFVPVILGMKTPSIDHELDMPMFKLGQNDQGLEHELRKGGRWERILPWLASSLTSELLSLWDSLCAGFPVGLTRNMRNYFEET